MPTIHEQIDELLAADVHEQLTPEVRQILHAHLVECAECRQAYKEQHHMHTLLQETFAEGEAKPGLEQRMLASFRNGVPHRAGFAAFLANALRFRATQITAAVALLLALMQVGRTISAFNAPRRDSVAASLKDRAERRDEARPVGSSLTNAPFTDQLKKDESQTTRMASNRGESGQVISSFSYAEADPFYQRERVAPAPAEPTSIAPSSVYAARAIKSKSSPSNASSQITTPEESAATSSDKPPTTAPVDNRKLIRNASVDLEVASFDESLQIITTLAAEGKGYVATTNSEKLANGKLRGQVVVKVLPENLDGFLGKLRGLGELKNQSITTEDVSKQYFDTTARMKNAQAMEARLTELMKRKSDDMNDLLAVEKELGRVREQIEQMQGELKFLDAQVQFATVTIALAEKDMTTPAGFLLKEHAQLALFTPEVEKIYNDIKALASPKVQITNAQLNRDNSGRVSANLSLLLAPEESDGVIAKAKAMGRVANFQVQTQRVARGGEGMSEQAKTERDKVELNITISREEQEAPLQQTTLNIRTGDVNARTQQLRELAEKNGGRIRNSSFERDPNGAETANVSLRVPLKNYDALMQALGGLGKLENISVHRDDRPDAQIDRENAPADISIQVFSQGNIVSADNGIWATIRQTIAMGARALMYSVTMIGVALAFILPWLLPLALIIWIVRRVRRGKKS